MLRGDRGAAFLFLAKKTPQKIGEVWRVSYRRCEIRKGTMGASGDQVDGEHQGIASQEWMENAIGIGAVMRHCCRGHEEERGCCAYEM